MTVGAVVAVFVIVASSVLLIIWEAGKHTKELDGEERDLHIRALEHETGVSPFGTDPGHCSDCLREVTRRAMDDDLADEEWDRVAKFLEVPQWSSYTGSTWGGKVVSERRY